MFFYLNYFIKFIILKTQEEIDIIESKIFEIIKGKDWYLPNLEYFKYYKSLNMLEFNIEDFLHCLVINNKVNNASLTETKLKTYMVHLSQVFLEPLKILKVFEFRIKFMKKNHASTNAYACLIKYDRFLNTTDYNFKKVIYNKYNKKVINEDF